MVPFKKGDFVCHRTDGEQLRIKSISETVATCEEIDKGKIQINIYGENVYPVRISHIGNLYKKNDPKADLTVSASGTVDTPTMLNQKRKHPKYSRSLSYVCVPDYTG